jgi:RNA recognition motif-containing protein
MLHRTWSFDIGSSPADFASNRPRLSTTGKSRGFGFVALTEGEDLQAAINVLNGQRMDGRVLTVNEATPLYTQAEPFAANAKPAPVQDPT